MKKILVTGGTGFIGSHTVVELLQNGYEVEVLDNLFNSKESVLDRIQEITGTRPKFYKVDLLDAEATNRVLADGHFDTVIHFAGLKAVGESVEKPLWYYENNIGGTLNLLKAMQTAGTEEIIFSSSATVYGDPGMDGTCSEDMETGHGITNPYGHTKYMLEEILKDASVADPELKVVLLRYFNPVGAHPSGLIGEDPNGRPNNLMPIIMRVAQGRIPELSVFGDDYDTPDGTCLRDYIHVVDLAKGHLAAIAALKSGWQVFNLGTGKGTSVLEMIAAFEKASGKKLPYKIAERRAGDLPVLCARTDKAAEELGWQTELTIEDAMRDTLKFLSNS